MKRILSSAILCVLALLAFCRSSARAQQSQPESPQGLRTSSEEVLLDVVVRDKKGHAVNNLKPEDFKIFDNGEPKQIRSFRLVQGNEAISAAGERAQLDPLRQIRLISLIFQSGSNDARRLARDASMDLLKSNLPQNVYMAVMTIDHRLEVLQAFTNDRALLKQAIDRATHSENTDFSQDTARTQHQLQEMLGPNTSGAPSVQTEIDNQAATAVASAQRGFTNGAAMANLAMAQMILQMLQNEQSMAMALGGRSSIYALLDAVREQYRLPGRKTILYFTEGGFLIPQGMEQPYRDIISVANRSNVSLYAIDTRGLTTMSSNSYAMDALKSAGESATSQLQNEGTGRAIRPDEAKVTDTSIQSTRGNALNTLSELAQSTGGALIANTNDVRDPLRRLEEDVMTYYEIAYSPQIANYDGSFRKISVKLSSNDLRVQTRSGYIALPPALTVNGAVLRAYEVPLLKALSEPQLPHDVNYHAEAMHFRGQQNQPVCELVIDVPLAGLSFQKNATGQMEGRLSYVALLKASNGEIQKKFQNEIPLRVPLAQQDALNTMHFIYTEHFDLSPGRYTMDTAVLDGANKIGARKSSIMVPAPSNSLAISSVSVVRSTKPKELTTLDSDPMLVGQQVVSPTINPLIKKSGSDAVSFYMVIYLDKAETAPPRLTMEFSRDGQVLGSGSPELSPPSKDGHIQYLATVPITSLSPGEYAVRFIVTQGTEAAEEAVSFTLQ